MKIYCCFPQGKFKVLTMSYDDGKKEDIKLIDIFNKYGIKGTFNLNSGLLDDKDRIQLHEIRELYKGHEIASHTYTHPTIGRCPIHSISEEILKDRSILEKECGYPVRGLAYPNGSYSQDIINLLPSLGIEYGRTVGSSFSFGMPEDFMKWQFTCHHNNRLIELGKEFKDLYKSQYLYMMCVWGHSYEFPQKNNWDLIEEFCRITSNDENTWYATNIEIVDYMKCFNNLKFAADNSFVYNPSSLSVWLSCDGSIFEIPGGSTIYF